MTYLIIANSIIIGFLLYRIIRLENFTANLWKIYKDITVKLDKMRKA